MGAGAATLLSLALVWRMAGVEQTYRARVNRLAFVSRYGHTGDWIFRVGGEFLQSFAEELASIVEEENRPRK